MAEKFIQTPNRAQDKDEGETNLLLQQIKVILVTVDNIEKQLYSKVDRLYMSLEKILKGELKKCVKEIQDNIDLEIGALKSCLDQLEKINSNNWSAPNKYDPDVAIIIMGLPYNEDEDLAQKCKEVFEDGCACEKILMPVAMQRLRAKDCEPEDRTMV